MLVWDMNNYSWFELIYSEWVCVFIVCAMKLCVVVNVCIQLTRVNVFRGCIWYLTSQYLHSVTMSFTGPEPEKDNQPLIIGVSVGIGIPVIVIIILLLCCCNRCYNKRKFFIHSSLINTCMLGMCGIYFFLFRFGFEKNADSVRNELVLVWKTRFGLGIIVTYYLLLINVMAE